MTRNGKIARLPHEVREELNRRLQNGEKGTHLAAWLNSLPAVRKVLKAEFGASAIRKQNISEWKRGGHREWGAHQEAVAEARRLATEAKDVGKATGGELGEQMSMWLMAQCAMAAGRMVRGEKPDVAEAEILQKLSRIVVALRRGDLYARWIGIEQERMEAETKLDPKKLEKQFREWARDPEIQHEFFGKPRMTDAEREEAFRQVMGLPPKEEPRTNADQNPT